MSVVGEVVGIVACVAAIVSAYHDGGDVIQKIKIRRAKKRAPPPSRLLEESIDQAGDDINREKNRGVSRFGRAFEEGDHIAVIALQQITIQLQGTLLQQLRNATFDDEVTDFRYLVDVADSHRDQTVDTLMQLRQRLLLAEPINELSPAISPTDMRYAEGGASQVSSGQTASKPGIVGREGTRRPFGPKSIPTKDADVEGEVSGTKSNRHKRRHGSLLDIIKHHRSSSHDKLAEQIARQPPPTQQPRRSPHSTSPSPSALRLPSFSGAKYDTHSGPEEITQPQWKYHDWEDNPAEIWSNEGNSDQSDRKASSTAPSPTTPAMQMRHPSIAPPSIRSQSLAVPTPTDENQYLGYCKGAVRLQNGDRKALEKRKEFNDGWSQSSVHYLACCSTKCAFACHLDIDTIWTRVRTDESRGIKFRWIFLAKSHVPQKYVKAHQYAYQCLFCTYAGARSTVYQGVDCYLNHVAEHRGPINDVILYKAKCIHDHVCDDSEDFDVNLWPYNFDEPRERKASGVLSDDLQGLSILDRKQSTSADSMFGVNEPWNAGLSNFHYGGEVDRTELG